MGYNLTLKWSICYNLGTLLYPKPIVYIRIHSWCLSFRFWQMNNEKWPMLTIESNSVSTGKFFSIVIAYPLPLPLGTTDLLIVSIFVLRLSYNWNHTLCTHYAICSLFSFTWSHLFKIHVFLCLFYSWIALHAISSIVSFSTHPIKNILALSKLGNYS